ncbi:MAG: lipoprotein-releasing ABC transporter permease subunit [Gammaproteobacteria bacterium]
MFRPYELFVGLRYLRAKRRNHFISFISLISIGGIAVGVMALITVLSVMNGFEKELRERVLGMASHATVAGFDEPLTDWREVQQAALAHPNIVGAAPYVQGEGMLTHGSQLSGTLIRGVLPAEEPAVAEIADRMVAGRLDDLEGGEWRVALGASLAHALGVGIGDRVVLMVPQATVTPAGVWPRHRALTVAGIFEVGMHEYDRSMAFMHLDDAATLFGLGDAVSGVRLKMDDMLRAPWIAREVAANLPGVYFVSDWTRQHANLFRAIQTEKTVMFVILALIVGVAAFNIVSTLVMVVTDKQADIAILRTLGAKPNSIMAIFMVQGSIIGVFGTALGIALGVALALNVETVVPVIERLLGFQVLPPDVYYISTLPSDLQAYDIVRIGVVALVLSLISTVYPAWRAARTQPAEALRYE